MLKCILLTISTVITIFGALLVPQSFATTCPSGDPQDLFIQSWEQLTLASSGSKKLNAIEIEVSLMGDSEKAGLYYLSNGKVEYVPEFRISDTSSCAFGDADLLNGDTWNSGIIYDLDKDYNFEGKTFQHKGYTFVVDSSVATKKAQFRLVDDASISLPSSLEKYVEDFVPQHTNVTSMVFSAGEPVLYVQSSGGNNCTFATDKLSGAYSCDYENFVHLTQEYVDEFVSTIKADYVSLDGNNPKVYAQLMQLGSKSYIAQAVILKDTNGAEFVELALSGTEKNQIIPPSGTYNGKTIDQRRDEIRDKLGLNREQCGAGKSENQLLLDALNSITLGENEDLLRVLVPLASGGDTFNVAYVNSRNETKFFTGLKGLGAACAFVDKNVLIGTESNPGILTEVNGSFVGNGAYFLDKHFSVGGYDLLASADEQFAVFEIVKTPKTPSKKTPEDVFEQLLFQSPRATSIEFEVGTLLTYTTGQANTTCVGIEGSSDTCYLEGYRFFDTDTFNSFQNYITSEFKKIEGEYEYLGNTSQDSYVKIFSQGDQEYILQAIKTAKETTINDPRQRWLLLVLDKDNPQTSLKVKNGGASVTDAEMKDIINTTLGLGGSAAPESNEEETTTTAENSTNQESLECQNVEANIVSQAEQNLHEVLEQRNFASVTIFFNSRNFTLYNENDSTELRPTEPSQVIFFEDIDTKSDACVLTKNETYYTPREPGASTEEETSSLLSPTTTNNEPSGLLYKILREYNGYSIVQAEEAMKSNQSNLHYRYNNAEYLVHFVQSGGKLTSISFDVVDNPFTVKESRTPRELIYYYFFDIPTPAKSMCITMGSRIRYDDQNTNIPEVCSEESVVNGDVGEYGTEYYTFLSKIQFERIFEGLYSMRKLKPNERENEIPKNNTFFHFVLGRGNTNKVFGIKLLVDQETNAPYQMQITECTEAGPQEFCNANFLEGGDGDIPNFLQWLVPRCESWTNFLTNTCGTEIPYCDSDNCGFSTGVDLVREDLQGSNVSTTNSLKELIRGWINFALGFLFLLAVVAIIVSGIMMVANFGNDDMIAKAKKIIIWAIVGIIVIVFAYPIVNTLVNVVQ